MEYSVAKHVFSQKPSSTSVLPSKPQFYTNSNRADGFSFQKTEVYCNEIYF